MSRVLIYHELPIDTASEYRAMCGFGMTLSYNPILRNYIARRSRSGENMGQTEENLHV